MKKLLTLLLALLMLFTMVGCNSNNSEDIPTIEEQPQVEEPVIVGGYQEVDDKNLTPELIEMFNSAFDGFTGASYTPVMLEATQVVAGINYKFKADGTKTTNPIIMGSYYVYINKDLQGNISLLDIEVIEEHEVKESKPEVELDTELKQDPTKLSYWVVFYNPDGHELYRTTMKYGSTPVYEGDTPSYWDSDNWYKLVCWTDKQGNEIKQFKPITGNTYIYAKYKMGGDLKKKDTVSSTPVPDPEYVQIDSLTSVPGAYINSKVTASNNMEFIFDAKMTKIEWSRCFGYYNSGNSGLGFQIASGDYSDGKELMYYASDGTNTYQYAASGVDVTQKNSYDVKYGGTTSNASYIKVNGTQVTSFTTGTINTSKEIHIFTLNDNDPTNNNKKPLTMYYMKIYKDGTLVRDYIPVRTLKEIDKSKNAADSTANIPVGTLCFYDKVDKLYYPSNGPKTFSDNPDHLEVECLSTSGTNGPYINTLLQVNDNMRFVFDAKAKTGAWTFMLGGYTAYVNGIALHPYAPPQYYEMYFGNHSNSNDSLVHSDAGLNQRSSYDFQVQSGNNYLIVNGVMEYSDTQTVSGVTPQDLYIFAENNKQNNKVNQTGPLTIYYMQIYQNGILVRDFIPVYTTSIIDKSKHATNPSADIPVQTYCMYDKLNDKYYTNAGNGSFTDIPIN